MQIRQLTIFFGFAVLLVLLNQVVCTPTTSSISTPSPSTTEATRRTPLTSTRKVTSPSEEPPTGGPTLRPTRLPTKRPTRRPTRRPTKRPARRPTRRPSVWPPCRQPAICTRRSPPVCGRTKDGNCQRFANICDLLRANSTPRGIIPVRTQWTHTNALDCRSVRGIGPRNARPCQLMCPRRLPPCPRTTPRSQVCVRSRNGRTCKLLANSCELRNLNCRSNPRNNWLLTARRQCRGLKVGSRPQRCRSPRKTTRPPRKSTVTSTQGTTASS